MMCGKFGTIYWALTIARDSRSPIRSCLATWFSLSTRLPRCIQPTPKVSGDGGYIARQRRLTRRKKNTALSGGVRFAGKRAELFATVVMKLLSWRREPAAGMDLQLC
jgi:hypothetical protein